MTRAESEPAYLALHRSGELARRAEEAWRRLEECDLCAHHCHVDRREPRRGAVCRTGERAVVSAYGPHHGEEDPIRGQQGSGTIFFSWCNLRCVFCQNWELSQRGVGREVDPSDLAAMMVELEAQGCHNINLVSPSHVVAQVLAAVLMAAGQGLRLPFVYNTGGYDSLEALRLLDGVVDIYMPDMKYADADRARRYSRILDYPAVNQAAVREMHRQVGDLVLDELGVAQRGLLIRHLVLPDDQADTDAVLAFIAGELSRDTYVNLMDQYRPCYRAEDFPPLNHPLTRGDYEHALTLAAKHGLHRLDRGRSRVWR